MDSTVAIGPWIEGKDDARRGYAPELDRIKSPSKHSMWQTVNQRLHKLLGRDQSVETTPLRLSPSRYDDRPLSATRRSCSPRKIGIGLPRMGTFKRQNSEKRDRLEPVKTAIEERRAISAIRQRSLSTYRPRSKSSPPPAKFPQRDSAPTFRTTSNGSHSPPRRGTFLAPSDQADRPVSPSANFAVDYQKFARSKSRSSRGSYERFRGSVDRDELEAELDRRWILNLSMHFRDKSDREKFFVTYAETPTKWRRVTVSCDYRNAEPGSLEQDLKELQFQRDKSIQIYEAIRDSLIDIQFYDTVTNLKLETSEGRLHVHVTEDQNEVVPYPPISSVLHILNDEALPPREIRECEIAFDSHLSGFVYKVKHYGQEYIKKEIPGPDTVDEFLYEINALHDLAGSESVISLEAVIVDDKRELVKGLLISYAEQGALVDLLYDHKREIDWDHRARWARQAVQGLSEIHEAGYVQGDLTLSNIVVDDKDNAKIIDINRRGCPVGWEPPEIAKKIASSQRISMYIGEKSDLYQLGMTLWALAMDDDEPERHMPPFTTDEFPLEVPRWYIEVVEICLSPDPRGRESAKELLNRFPEPESRPSRPALPSRSSTLRALDKQYIPPEAAVEREDIERLGPIRTQWYDDEATSRDSNVDQVFTEPRSTNYRLDSSSSYGQVTRGRRPVAEADLYDNHIPRHEDSGIADLDLLEPCVTPAPDQIATSDYNDQSREIDLPIQPFPEPQLPPNVGGPSQPTSDFIPYRDHLQMDRDAFEMDPESEHISPGDEDIDLDDAEQKPTRPSILRHVSSNSGSTPRNMSSFRVPTFSTLPLPTSSLDPAAAYLAGLGGHPALEVYSPHEPGKTTFIHFAEYEPAGVALPVTPPGEADAYLEQVELS